MMLYHCIKGHGALSQVSFHTVIGTEISNNSSKSVTRNYFKRELIINTISLKCRFKELTGVRRSRHSILHTGKTTPC